MLQPHYIEQFRRDVEAELPPAMVEVFSLAEPFVTTINDVEPSRMVFGRRVLVGDAAAATRPHVSASTARAMRAAWGLATALRAAGNTNDIATQLALWEREHVAIAQEFTERGRMIGRRLQVDWNSRAGCAGTDADHDAGRAMNVVSQSVVNTLRSRCAGCGHEKLVAFSCKRRGICPSCGARRMAESAAWLVDRVIPKVPVRQWAQATHLVEY